MSKTLTGGLSRWSQRKAAARRGGALPEDAGDTNAVVNAVEADEQTARVRSNETPESRAVASAPHTTPAPEEPVPALPPIESLTFQSDFTVFMAKGVPEAMRRAALRKLWVSDPILANLDGLNDYCEDHHAIDMAMTLNDTSYKIGKGFLDEVVDDEKAEQEREVAARAEQPTSESPAIAASENSQYSDGNSDAPPAVPPEVAAHPVVAGGGDDDEVASVGEQNRDDRSV